MFLIDKDTILSDAHIEKFGTKIYNLIVNDNIKGCSQVRDMLVELDCDDWLVHEFADILEIFILESESIHHIHSFWNDSDFWEEMLEKFEFYLGLVRKSEYEKIDEMLENKQVSYDAIRVTQKYSGGKYETCMYEKFLLPKETPLVTIVVPAYNAEGFISDTINSVLNQTYSNIELIVVDDASSDKTLDVINSFVDSRMVVIHNEVNCNVCISSNKAFLLAKGKYIVLSGHDDVSEPTRIAQQISFMEEHPSYSATFSFASIIDDEGAFICDDEKIEGLKYMINQRAVSSDLSIRDLAKGINRYCAPTAMIRGEVLQRLGGYKNSFLQLQDYNLWLEILSNGKIYKLSNSLVRYRQFRNKSKNLSSFSPKSKNRSTHEMIYILYNYINEMEDLRFCEIFRDEINIEILKNYEQVQIRFEKIKYMLEHGILLAVNDLYEMLNDNQQYEILQHIYGYSINDFYKLNSYPIYNGDVVIR